MSKSFTYHWAHGTLNNYYSNTSIKKSSNIKKSSSLNNLNGNVRDGFQGFADLVNDLNKYIKSADNAHEVLVDGAKLFINDLNKLAKPYSKIRKSGYTHLIDTFTYEDKKDEVIVGWGKYYGRMVENGTDKMKARPHFYPVWDKNKEKYYNYMIKKLNF